MSLPEIFFTAVFLVTQTSLIFLCFGRRLFEIIHGRRLLQLVTFLSLQALCLLLLLLGGYSEARWDSYSVIRGLIGKPRSSWLEAFEARGDPGLVHWVARQQPALPRPDFTNTAAVGMWQTSLRSTLLQLFHLPNIASPVSIDYLKISSTVVTQNIMRVFLAFESFDGTRIPAYLFTPLQPGAKPAILVLHGHVGWDEDGINQTAGIDDSYHNGAALALAKEGYVTLTMGFRGFGYLGIRANTDLRFITYNALLGGSFYKAIVSRDIKYAIDLLQSLEDVDPHRIGITGVSYGGEMAVTYAALDERIQVIVFQGFGGTVGVERGIDRTSQDTPYYTHIIPGHNVYLLQEDLFFLIAPRPLLGVRGDKDNFGDHKLFSQTVGELYATLNASSLFRFEILPGGHEYIIQPAIQFFKQHL
jgi:dienelactone hydrolase